MVLRPIKNPWFLAEFLARRQHTMSGRIHPSGRFSLGSPPKSGFPKRDEVERDEEKSAVRDLPAEAYATCPYGGNYSCPVSKPQEGFFSGEPLKDEDGIPLGSSKPAISHKRGKRGCRGISAKASAQLTYWMEQMELRFGRRNLSFLTLTVPEVDECDRTSIQDNWSEIVRRYLQELKREMIRRGARFTNVLGCTEIQLERAKKYGWDVPHLHLVFLGRVRPSSDWMFSPEEIRGLWQRIVSRYLSNPDIDFRSSENVQSIRFSCARYLGKYLSKSKSKSGDETVSSEWHPSDYIIIPSKLRHWYRAQTVSGFSIAQYIHATIGVASEIHGFWMKPITIKTSIGEQVMGWVGVNPEWRIDAPDDIWPVL